MNISSVIIACNESSAMKSKRSKYVQKTAGRPIISWVKNALDRAGATDQVYIVGQMQDQTRQVLGEEVAYVIQEEKKGTGNAVLQASAFLEGRIGYTFVIRGNAPLIEAETLQGLLDYAVSNKLAALIATSESKQSSAHGHIVRSLSGHVAKILKGGEFKAKKTSVRDTYKKENPHIYEINTGLYLFNTAMLVSALGQVSGRGAKVEIAMSDVLDFMIKNGRAVGAYKVNFEQTMVVENKYQLMQVSQLMNQRICKHHMLNGVTIVDPRSTWIEAEVKIAADAEIYPNTVLEGDTEIGEDAVLGPDTRITDSFIDKESVVFNSIVCSSRIGRGVNIGPYAYIRQESDIDRHARVGHCVEVKNSKIGRYSKAPNMALISDADLGENVNYGCGCITVNFDGNKQSRTRIGENAFVGSNSNLIAPVDIADNTYIAAGSTITDDVPSYAMAIARNRQTVKNDWVKIRNRVRSKNNL